MAKSHIQYCYLTSLDVNEITCASATHMWYFLLVFLSINEQRHEISNNVVCATSKVSDQPAQMHSLIRAFASRLNMLRVLSY